MLDTIPKLCQYRLREILRILCNKVDPHSFWPDEANDLLNFFKEELARIIKQEVGFIKEEDKFWFF